jgi:hypothetical protein
MWSICIGFRGGRGCRLPSPQPCPTPSALSTPYRFSSRWSQGQLFGADCVHVGDKTPGYLSLPQLHVVAHLFHNSSLSVQLFIENSPYLSSSPPHAQSPTHVWYNTRATPWLIYKCYQLGNVTLCSHLGNVRWCYRLSFMLRVFTIPCSMEAIKGRARREH